MRGGWIGAVLALGAVPVVAGCSAGCDDTAVTRVAAPGGRLDAVVFVRECGATTGFSTQVSVVGHGGPVSGGGNVFSADDDDGAVPLAGAHHSLVLDLRWLAGNRLHIGYPARARVFLHDSRHDAVRVEYQRVT